MRAKSAVENAWAMDAFGEDGWRITTLEQIGLIRNAIDRITDYQGRPPDYIKACPGMLGGAVELFGLPVRYDIRVPNEVIYLVTEADQSWQSAGDGGAH